MVEHDGTAKWNKNQKKRNTHTPIGVCCSVFGVVGKKEKREIMKNDEKTINAYEDPEALWGLEVSIQQKRFHVARLESCLASNQSAFLRGLDLGWSLIFIGNFDECSKVADEWEYAIHRPPQKRPVKAVKPSRVMKTK